MSKALDRIVSTKETLHKIIGWSLANNYLLANERLNVENFSRNIPLTEGVVEKEHSENGKVYTETQTFKVSEDLVKGNYEVKQKGLDGFYRTYFVIDFIKHEIIEIFHYLIHEKADIREQKPVDSDLRTLVANEVLFLILTLIFIREFREDKEVITEKSMSFIKPNKPKKKSKKKSVVKIGVYYINPNFQIALEKRKFERHAEAWGVRGHWRTYKKSGKRVWIPEYKKGKGEKETKEYKIQ